MTDLIAITYNDKDEPVISGRDLHERLEIKTAYKDWFPRMCEYGFEETKDFNSLKFEQVQYEGDREVKRMFTDHVLTLDMAKQLCMIQRTDKGRQFREYFIEVERAWNSPEQIKSRAIRILDRENKEKQQKIEKLETDNSKMAVALEIARPKAEYFDELVNRNTLTNFRDTAKLLGIPEKRFVKFLLDHDYVYRDKAGSLRAYSKKNDGLFEVKEYFSERSDWHGTQTLITPKGRETFRLLCQGV